MEKFMLHNEDLDIIKNYIKERIIDNEFYYPVSINSLLNENSIYCIDEKEVSGVLERHHYLLKEYTGETKTNQANLILGRLLVEYLRNDYTFNKLKNINLNWSDNDKLIILNNLNIFTSEEIFKLFNTSFKEIRNLKEEIKPAKGRVIKL